MVRNRDRPQFPSKIPQLLVGSIWYVCDHAGSGTQMAFPCRRSAFAMPQKLYRSSRSNARRDMVFVVLSMVAGFLGSIYFEPFEVVSQFDQLHPDWHSDDAATGLVFGSISLIWFAKRRMAETLNGARLAEARIEAERYQALERQTRALAEVADELAQARDHALAADRLK